MIQGREGSGWREKMKTGVEAAASNVCDASP